MAPSVEAAPSTAPHVPAAGAWGTAAPGEPRAPVIAIQGVTLRYPTSRGLLTACEDIDIALRQHERLVLLGPSGCGKSSLLAAVAGFLRPAAGRILVDGAPVRRPGPDRMMVFQEFDQLLPWKTVRANVAYPLLLAGVARDQATARADALLAKVGLAGFADAYPHTLSGGMKMRAAIARALAAAPRVLLMDEPFAALDALTRRRMQEELLLLWREQPFSLIFVTHSIEEATLVGSRVLVLSAHPGRVRMAVDVPPDADPTVHALLHERLRTLLLPGVGHATEEKLLHA
ncbi:Alkanesulfonates ABC transporter ATP-binding protein / Sulfonate ABC transporter, ATP-binding subunit SsuB [Rhodovastum atsumiense]|uniref:ABC transporter ATP-binding protein n=1 Tax=Rhodovastum atsumiense TaxID=504468 RepID=A0A5M6IT33_9PROT|nr:ABC transporter ATP-binding protein [Rhodovastum atsumiense]KAA5611483.1 ABC transporter ATP-binding protein [Rhodovastum atsumiense]CAH2601175.1 Alkanesulfonates ABC transporter ATP-binding protein / Sulfonate ABC transporter, ATP-binding subunit SsuB [Rhodovastum atsumiense]